MTDPTTNTPHAARVVPRSDRAATGAPHPPSDAPTDGPHTPWLAAFAVLAAIAFGAWTISGLIGASDDPAADVRRLWTCAGVAVGLVACACGVIGLVIEVRGSVARRRRGDGGVAARSGSSRRAPGARPSSPKDTRRSSRARDRTGAA